jgi:hypothetical protein
MEVRLEKLLKHKIEAANVIRRLEGDIKDPSRYLWTLNPIPQTVLWICTIFIGAWSSLSSVKIMNFILPWDSLPDATVNWYSTSYLVLIILVALFFSISKWVARTQDSYVIDSILTMPPSTFWENFNLGFQEATTLGYMNSIALDEAMDNYREIALTDITALKGEKLEEYYKKRSVSKIELKNQIGSGEEDVRRILDCGINLVKLWDSNNTSKGNIVYRANIMLVHRFSSTPINILRDIENIAKPFTIANAENHYSGYVGIRDSNYSTTTSSKRPTPDDVEPIAFPFTESSIDILYPFETSILGAPVAAATGFHSYVQRPSEIIEHYERSDNVNKLILQNLKVNYTNSSKADSILSIPVTDITTGTCMAVLNIYRNLEGLLYSGQKTKDFTQIILPFTTILASAISELEEVKNELLELDSDG